MRLRWYRWTVVTVGKASGNRYPVSFIRFRHKRQADAWCLEMNTAMHQAKTYVFFEPQEIK